MKYWVAACLLVFAAAPARAAVVVHLGSDAGAGPADSAPNAAVAQAAFEAAAGTITRVDFESVPVGNFSTLNIAPGVSATLSGTDNAEPPGFDYGISSDHPDVKLGYNVTTGGSKFLRVTPLLGAGVASLALHFSDPVTAIGLTITGLGVSTGPLYAIYGPGQEVEIIGSDSGGRIFFGLTGLDDGLTDLRIELRDVPVTSRDVFAVDDLLFHVRDVGSAAVPEPATWLPALLGSAAAGALGWRSRRRGQAT